MSEELIITIENPVEIFQKNQVDAILDQIAAAAKSNVFDIATAQGRKDCASVAYKVSKAKVFLDTAGKELVAEWKKKAGEMDADRKKIRDTLDALKDEVRRPLTAWEDEKAKVEAAYNEHMAALLNPVAGLDDLDAMRNRLRMVELYEPVAGFAAAMKTALVAEKSKAVEKIRDAIAKREKEIADAAELERLRKEKEDRDRADRERQIKEEAAKEAREQAQAETAKATLRMEQEKKDAEDRAAEAERKAEEAKAKAKADAEAAAQRERDLFEEQRRKADADRAKREADQKHRADVMNAAWAALVKAGLSQESAKVAVVAIAEGRVDCVRMEF